MTKSTIRLDWAVVADFEGHFDALGAGLPLTEQARARRFRVPAANRRFVLARTLVRHTLGEHLGVGPETLTFGVSEHGKPHLVKPTPPTDLGFNLSHSGEFVVLVTAAGEIGVDVEELRPVPKAGKLAQRFFSAAERDIVLGLQGADRDRAFLRVWTQKEAWLKATGLGVGMRLADVETEADPAVPPRLLAISDDRERAARWSFAEAGIPRAVCVVAVDGPIDELVVRRITPDDIARP